MTSPIDKMQIQNRRRFLGAWHINSAHAPSIVMKKLIQILLIDDVIIGP